MKWDFTDKRNIEVFAYFLPSTFSKNMDLLVAMWTLKIAHVFDDANNWHIELVEHAYGLNCDIHGNVLGSCDYENACYRNRLRYRKGSVTSSRRQINYEI